MSQDGYVHLGYDLAGAHLGLEMTTNPVTIRPYLQLVAIRGGE